MATKGKRPMRAVTPGDKIEAIQRVNDGESKASVARDIGVPESTLRGWCKNEDKLRYMTSHLSSPDTDKSSDGEPRDKRARTQSPPAAASPPAPPAPDAPVELTTRRSPPAPRAPPRPRAEPGACVSMSAISPLSGLAHLPPLAHSHLGLSFNEIATNLTLLAQLSPGLGALQPAPGARALRSVRSPKPAHSAHAMDKHRSKSHHADPYRLGAPAAAATPPVDDTLWYWLKTQQAMLDLTAQSAAPLALSKPPPEPAAPPRAAAAAPLAPHLDYNRNSWLWQYYKQFGGAAPPPGDKLRPASQVPKENKTPDNILYSQLTKGKDERAASPAGAADPAPGAERPPSTERPATTERPPSNERPPSTELMPTSTERAASIERASSVERAVSAERAASERVASSARSARTVLDRLLLAGGGDAGAGATGAGAAGGAAEALAHGHAFLAWLEASGDPAVTRVHVAQLRALLHNLRRRAPAPAHAH